MHCIERFSELYRKEPSGVSFCPYRVCPVGAHIDHQLGKITGLAIDSGIHMAYSAKHNGVVELCSLQFEKRAQWHVRSVPETRQQDWADYLRGVTLALGSRYPLNEGLCGVIEGSLPIGGLSSSAAVCIAFLKALCDVNGIVLAPSELVLISKEAENSYVGVECGKLDQSCEVYSKRGHLLYLDTQSDEYELIASPRQMRPFDIVIFFSGLERSLVGSKFNMRVDEVRSAAYALKAYSGMEYGKFDQTVLRDVPREIFEEYKDRLPDNWRKRAEHFYSEFDRVELAAQAWKRADLETYGRLCFESGRSSIENWETGSEELKALYYIMTRTPGIYGGRFSGAGFKGCCMALVNPEYTQKVIAEVGKSYLRIFPALENKFSTCVCESSDGVGV